MDAIDISFGLAKLPIVTSHQNERYTLPTLVLLSVIRLAIIPLLVVRPVLAVALSIFVDEFDGYIINILTPWSRAQYQLWDKVFDFFWYVALIIYSKRIFSLERFRWLVFFFWFRMAGQLLFLFVPREEVFLFFPNYFENLFIVWLLDKKWPWFGRMMKKKYGSLVIYLIAFAIAIVREIIVHLGSARVQIW